MTQLIKSIKVSQGITVTGATVVVKGVVKAVDKLNNTIVILDDVTRKFHTIYEGNLHTIKNIDIK